MLWVIAGQIFAAFGMLAVLTVNLQFVGNEGIGELSLCLTVVLVINQLVFVGPNSSINRYIHYFNADLNTIKKLAFRNILSQINRIKYILLFALSILFFVLDVSLLNIFVSILFGFSSGLFSISNTVSNALNQRKSYAAQIIFEMTFRIVASYIAASIFSTVFAIILALIISTSIGAFFSFRNIKLNLALNCNTNVSIDEQKLSESLAYAGTFAKWGIINWVFLSLDRILISESFGLAITGQYAILYQLAYSPVSMIISTVLTYLSPQIFKTASLDPQSLERADTYAKKLTLAAIATGFVCAIAAQAIANTLQDQKLFESSLNQYVWLFVIAGTFSGSTYIATLLLSNKRRADLVILPRNTTACFGAVLYFAASFLREPSYFLYANILSSLVFIIWVIVMNKKICSENVQ